MGKRVLNRRLNKKYKKQRLIFILILILIIIYLIPKYVSFSKYVFKKLNNHYIESNQFYFSSDKLTTIEGFEYQMPNEWSGEENYPIIVNMYSKQNEIAVAPNDIEYEITCSGSPDITCSLSKTSGTILGYENGGTNEDYFIITINPAEGVTLDSGDTVWVDITASATSPYIATLSGRILVTVGGQDFEYKIADWENSPYLQLDTTSKSATSTNVHLSFDPNVILLDMTSEVYQNATSNTTQILNGYNYVQTLDFTMESLANKTIKFYKVDATQNYSYSAGDTNTPIISVTYSTST